jgi:hypothetical protein
VRLCFDKHSRREGGFVLGLAFIDLMIPNVLRCPFTSNLHMSTWLSVTGIVQSQLGLDISKVPGISKVSAALASINGLFNLTEVCALLLKSCCSGYSFSTKQRPN